MRKTCSMILAILMTASMSVSVMAAETEFIGSEPASDIVSIREDISTAEALTDASFSTAKSRQSRDLARARAGATWKTGGDRVWATVGGVYGAKPRGWSEQVNDSTGKVEPTYHYTNVYFNYSGKQYGGSGRKWGNNRVTATGTHCHKDIANYGTLTVKYGIDNN